jgi:ribosomal protein L37AE/L43A
MLTKSSKKVAQKYCCEDCNYNTVKKRNYEKHLLTGKHVSLTDVNTKVAQKYCCENCNYNTVKKRNYEKHLLTGKHVSLTDVNTKVAKSSSVYICNICNKSYKSRVGLWSHKKKCSQQPKEKEEVKSPNSQVITIDVVMEIMRKNTEVQNMLIEQNTKLMEKITELSKPHNNTVTNTNTNSNNSNSNNNSFNLNFFLNEQCKDAINLVDFIDNLKVTVKDLERTGQIGFVEGISKIFIEGLKELDIYKRPIHCTDLKRETVYVRDQDKWEKENEEKPRLKTAVKKIAVKNIKQLRNWEVENPEFSNVDSKKNDEYMVISQNSLGGLNDKEDVKYENTIIKNVLKTAKLPTEESLVSTS